MGFLKGSGGFEVWIFRIWSWNWRISSQNKFKGLAFLRGIKWIHSLVLMDKPKFKLQIETADLLKISLIILSYPFADQNIYSNNLSKGYERITFNITPFCWKSARVCQSQNFPVSCMSRPVADRPGEAARREILGLAYARTFSAKWNTADRGKNNWKILRRSCYFSVKFDLSSLKQFRVHYILGAIQP